MPDLEARKTTIAPEANCVCTLALVESSRVTWLARPSVIRREAYSTVNPITSAKPSPVLQYALVPFMISIFSAICCITGHTFTYLRHLAEQ